MTNSITAYSKLKRYLAGMLTVVFAAVVVTTINIPITRAAAAPNAPFQVGSKTYNLDQFRGRKVMLWLFSTWCPSCQVGLKALSDKQQQLKKSGLIIIALENYKNGGYQGPTIRKFVGKYGKSVAKSPNWFFGNASAELARIYNPKGYPDIYFLIDEKGIIRNINDAPAVTIDKIVNFAAGKNLLK